MRVQSGVPPSASAPVPGCSFPPPPGEMSSPPFSTSLPVTLSCPGPTQASPAPPRHPWATRKDECASGPRTGFLLVVGALERCSQSPNPTSHFCKTITTSLPDWGRVEGLIG